MRKYVFAVLMAVMMSIIMSLLGGGIQFPKSFLIMAAQSVISVLATLVFDAGGVGAKWVHTHFPNAHYVVQILLSSILPTIYFTVIMSFTGMLMAEGYSADFWGNYLRSLPLFTLIGYVVSVIIAPILDALDIVE